MSFIVAGLALLLALIASVLLDGTSGESKRDATSHPFMRGEPEHEADVSGADAQPLPMTSGDILRH